MKIGKVHTLIWGTLFLLIVAFTLHVTQLFIMAVAVGLLAPLSYLLSSRSLNGLKVQRRLPSRLTAGEPTQVSLVAHNTSSQHRLPFTVQDLLPEGLSAPQDNQHLIVDLASGQQQTVTYQMLPLRRGLYELSALKLITTDLIGLFEFATSVAQPQQLLVYPKPIPLPDMWRTATASRGSYQTTRRTPGPGPDLYGVREYIPGDDLRKIHWKATAHRGKLTVIEREQAQKVAATVVLDLSANAHTGWGNESSLEYGVTLAASLLAQALQQDRRATLIAHGAIDYSVPASKHPNQQMQFLDALARVQADCQQSLRSLVNEKRRQLYQAGSVVVISPQVGQSMMALVTTLQKWGNSVTWFSLVGPSFEGQADSEARYQGFAAALRRQGCRSHIIRAGAGLVANITRRQRIAS